MDLCKPPWWAESVYIYLQVNLFVIDIVMEILELSLGYLNSSLLEK